MGGGGQDRQGADGRNGCYGHCGLTHLCVIAMEREKGSVYGYNKGTEINHSQNVQAR